MEAEACLVVFPAGRIARRQADGTLADPPWAATAAAVVMVFVIAYVALRLAGHWVTSHLHSQAALGAVDRTIGLGFGVLRALVFLGVFYLVFNLATPPELMPRWIADAKLLPVARASGEAIQAVAPKGLKVAGGLRPTIERAVRGDDAGTKAGADTISDPVEATRRSLDAAVRASQAQKAPGYDNRSRDSIDDLIERSR
jgi:membrane protein required for colicin V production